MNNIDKGMDAVINLISRSKKFVLTTAILNKILSKIIKKIERELRKSVKNKKALLRDISQRTLSIRRLRGFSGVAPLFETGQLAKSLAILYRVRGRGLKKISFGVTARRTKRMSVKRKSGKYPSRTSSIGNNRDLFVLLKKKGFNFNKFIIRKLPIIIKEIKMLIKLQYKKSIKRV